MSNIITARDIEMVTSDIHYAQRQGARQLLSNLIEIGRLLVEAKSMVPHGEWGKYLEEKVNYSQSTANNYMKLYQEYGDNQESFFSSFSNSQAFGNLTYTQAIALLALPAEERQEFAETNDVADMSTRQLEQAIRERNEERAARERAEELAEKAQQELLAQEKATAAEKDNVARLRDLQAKAKGEANAANEMTRSGVEIIRPFEASPSTRRESPAFIEKSSRASLGITICPFSPTLTVPKIYFPLGRPNKCLPLGIIHLVSYTFPTSRNILHQNNRYVKLFLQISCFKKFRQTLRIYLKVCF